MKKKTQKNNKSLKKALKRKKYVRGSKTTVKNPSQKDLENMRKKGLSTTLPTTPAKKKTKSRVNEAGNYTKPTMRKRLFQKIKAGSKGGAPGQWSARKEIGRAS